MRMTWGAVGVALAVMGWGGGYAAGPAAADDALAGWDARITQEELAAQSGFGVVVKGENIAVGDGNVAFGNGNNAAQSTTRAKVDGTVVADKVRAGDVHHIHVDSARGFNVFQINTAPNVNQVVNQALIVNIVDPKSAH